MKEDTPHPLQKTQEWFASMITHPLNEEQPPGAEKYIASSDSLSAGERINLYNQQYWWRLLSTLEELCPCLLCLFGKEEFHEKIATPYLRSHPPHHWSLNLLNQQLPQWVDEHYHEVDRPLIVDVTKIDTALQMAFIAGEKTPLNLEKLSAQDKTNILSLKFALQPHIYLFTLRKNLFLFREALTEKGADYWQDNDFPPIPPAESGKFIIYRTAKNRVLWKEIHNAEYYILEKLGEGVPLDVALESLESESPEECEEAARSLSQWCRDWIKRGWIHIEK